MPLPASFYGLNREHDKGLKIQCDEAEGVNIRLQGGEYFNLSTPVNTLMTTVVALVE